MNHSSKTISRLSFSVSTDVHSIILFAWTKNDVTRTDAQCEGDLRQRQLQMVPSGRTGHREQRCRDNLRTDHPAQSIRTNTSISAPSTAHHQKSLFKQVHRVVRALLGTTRKDRHRQGPALQHAADAGDVCLSASVKSRPFWTGSSMFQHAKEFDLLH